MQTKKETKRREPKARNSVCNVEKNIRFFRKRHNKPNRYSYLRWASRPGPARRRGGGGGGRWVAWRSPPPPRPPRQPRPWLPRASTASTRSEEGERAGPSPVAARRPPPPPPPLSWIPPGRYLSPRRSTRFALPCAGNPRERVGNGGRGVGGGGTGPQYHVDVDKFEEA